MTSLITTPIRSARAERLESLIARATVDAAATFSSVMRTIAALRNRCFVPARIPWGSRLAAEPPNASLTKVTVPPLRGYDFYSSA